MSHTYDSHFMDYTAQSSRYSARSIITKVREVLQVTSVLDIGCARGTWLDEWNNAGTEDIFGVDGAYVKPAQLIIAAERFRAADLSTAINLGRRFELVQSLEVAEHIRADAADQFVENLVRHSTGIILFSAAPPGQGGEHHVNEQPYDYWREKFRKHGFEAYDYIRPLIANDKSVSFWYRYNTLLYIHNDAAVAVGQQILLSKIDRATSIPDIAPLLFRMRKRLVRELPGKMQHRLAQYKARANSYFNRHC